MIRNYLTTSYRFIVKSKTYTILNLAGLVAGLTASFILLIFTLNELSYDRYHQNYEQIYRILFHDLKGNRYALSSFSLGPTLEHQVKGIKETVRIANPGFITGPVLVQTGELFSEEPSFYCADKEILTLFDLELLQGDKFRCLDSDSTIVLSETAAIKYFGTTPPLGRHLRIKTLNYTKDFTVSGIFRDFPWNSTIRMEIITGINVFPAILSTLFDSTDLVRQLGSDPCIETFLYLEPGVGPGEISGQIGKGTTPFFSFQPLRDIYLGSADINDLLHKKGNRSTMYVYILLAFFVLLLAGINYSILSTARSALRYQEIGVRKVMGASRAALSGQVLAESTLLTFLSFPISYLLLGLMEPLLQWLLGYQIRVYSYGTLILIPIFAGITLFIGLVSGSYIAFYLSSLNPLQALKHKISSPRKINLSKVFIVFQLLITLSLLIAVITIYRQVNFCMNGEQGFNKDNLAVLGFDPSHFKHYRELKKAITDLPEVISVAGSSIIPPDVAIKTQPVNLMSTGMTIDIELLSVDAGFFGTMGIPILKGVDFDPLDSAKGRFVYIINQEAEKQLQIKDFKYASLGATPIIGLARDFNFHTTHNKINPIAFSCNPDIFRAVVIRYSEGKWESLSKNLEKIWTRIAPGQAFNLKEFSNNLNLLYKQERIFGYVVTSFAILAFIIMGMGLFGLALLISERRTKEMAIRKVFGASTSAILAGMMREFLVYTAIASVMAIPVTTYFLQKWLNTFYYKVKLDWWIFVISVAAITIFVATIILTRTLRVLRKNPVNALKYE